MKHLNPRQGITTIDTAARRYYVDLVRSVKHLNPRQGITTGSYRMTHCLYRQTRCVKHLNPRQGITTQRGRRRVEGFLFHMCETPKSPPGDYNSGKETARQVVGRLKYVVVAVGSISIARGNEV